MATIPSAYGALGRMLPTVQQPVAPDINSGMAVPSALARFGDALGNAGFNAVERTDIATKQTMDTQFKRDMVAANQKLDEATQKIIRTVPAQEQKAALAKAADTIKSDLFGEAPAFTHHYLPTFEEQMVKSGEALAKAQEAALQSSAIIGTIDQSAQIQKDAELTLKLYDPKDPTSAQTNLNGFKTRQDESLNREMQRLTEQFGPAKALTIMEPVISSAKAQLLALQKGMTKVSQDHVLSDVETGVNAIRNSALPVGEILTKIGTIVNTAWSSTGKSEDERIKYLEKQYQDVSKETIDKDFSMSLPDGKHDAQGIAKLEAFVQRWDSKNADGTEYAALPGMDKLTRQSYVKQAQEKIKTERDRIAKETKEKMTQDFSLAKDQIQDAMSRGEMPEASLFVTLNRTAQSKMQSRYVQELTAKANSASFQIKAMAENPFRYTVSTLPDLKQSQKNALLQPLTAGNMATLLPARMAIALKYNVPPLTADEATSLVKMAEKRGVSSAIATSNAITKGMPLTLRNITIGFISDTVRKQNQPLGNALALSTFDPQLAGLYINSAELLKDKTTDKDTQKNISAFRDDIVKRFAGTGITNYPTEYDRAVDIYTTTLAGIQARTGSKPDSDVSDRLFKKLVGEVETTSTGALFGSKTQTIIPDGLNKDKVLNFTRNDHPDIAGMYGVDAKTLRAPLTWTPGGYKLLRDGKYVKGSNSVDIVLPFEMFQ